MVQVPLPGQEAHVAVRPLSGDEPDPPHTDMRLPEQRVPIDRASAEPPSGAQHARGLANHGLRAATMLERPHGEMRSERRASEWQMLGIAANESARDARELGSTSSYDEPPKGDIRSYDHDSEPPT